MSAYSIGFSLLYGIEGDYAWQYNWWAYQGFINTIKRNVKPDQSVFMEDMSGRLAIFSGRHFVDGDGFVNSHEYFDKYVVPGKIADYLQDRKIDYFLSSNVVGCSIGKRMPWSRDLYVLKKDEIPMQYMLVIDLSYLTHIPMKVSKIYFNPEDKIFDACMNGIREVMFRVRHKGLP